MGDRVEVVVGGGGGSNTESLEHPHAGTMQSTIQLGSVGLNFSTGLSNVKQTRGDDLAIERRALRRLA